MNKYKIDTNDKESVNNVLLQFQKSNKNFITLVRTFNLEWRQPVLGEYLTNKEIINNLKNIEIMSKFTEITVEQTEKLQFIKGLEEKGDIIEGAFKGSIMIDFKNDRGEVKVFVIEIEKIEYLLPTNYELMQKLTKLETIKDGKPCDIEIEITGFTKIDGGKKVKNFKVLSN